MSILFQEGIKEKLTTERSLYELSALRSAVEVVKKKQIGERRDVCMYSGDDDEK